MRTLFVLTAVALLMLVPVVSVSGTTVAPLPGSSGEWTSSSDGGSSGQKPSLGTAGSTGWGVLMGDANCDGIVDMRDYAIWYNNSGTAASSAGDSQWDQESGWYKADFNGDGYVDFRDYAVWFNNMGMVGAIQPDNGVAVMPEPLTITGLAAALMGVAGYARRRLRQSRK